VITALQAADAGGRAELMARDAASSSVAMWWRGLQNRAQFLRLKRAMIAAVSCSTLLLPPALPPSQPNLLCDCLSSFLVGAMGDECCAGADSLWFAWLPRGRQDNKTSLHLTCGVPPLSSASFPVVWLHHRNQAWQVKCCGSCVLSKHSCCPTLRCGRC
jgi:hypothetical protein